MSYEAKRRPSLSDEARSAMLSKHAYFPRWCVRRWFPGLSGEDLDEATGIASLALCEASIRFDAKRGSTFANYAAKWCRGAVLRWITTENKRGFARTQEPHSVLSINMTAIDGVSLADLLTTEFGTEADSRLDAAKAMESLQMLEPRRRDVLLAFHVKGHSATDIAKHLGISVRRVYQLRQSALDQLREYLAC